MIRSIKIIVFFLIACLGFSLFTPQASAATTYTIKTSVNSTSYGSITKTSSVNANGSYTISSTPKSGYYLSDLQVDGKSVGASSPYQLTNINKNYDVKAVFSKQVKVLLDAGHYGKYNKSPVYSSYYESDMNWKFHNYLKTELLKYNGFAVGVTRSTQAKDMEVYSRGKAAAGYDLFLSIHSNATSSSTTDYPLVVTQKGDASHALAKSLGKTMQDTMKTKQAYQSWQKLESDGKTEYYGVLRGSKSAGTLGMILEHSFHTNLTAAKWLYSNTNLQKMAAAEAKSIASYYKLKLKSPASQPQPPAPTQPKPVPTQPKPAAPKPKPAAPKPTDKITSTLKVKVTVSSLAFRQSNSTSSKKMGTAKKNATYQLKTRTRDMKWGQLKTNGYWIYLKGYTKAVTAAKPAATRPAATKPTDKISSKLKVKVTVSSLAFRKSNSTSSKKMGTAKKNATYQLKARTRDMKWGQLKTNGYWIYLKGYTRNVK